MDLVTLGLAPATWSLLLHPEPPTEREFMEIIRKISEQIRPEGWEKRMMWHHGSRTWTWKIDTVKTMSEGKS